MKKYLFLLSVLLLVVFYAPGTSSEHPSAPQEQTLASATTMEAEVPGFFLALLPPPEEWPHPLAMLWRATHLHQAVKNQLTSADWVKLKQMAPSLPLAIVAVEDKRFYEHNGIDLDGIFRATLANIQADEIVQGGSTITQQLIKNVLLTSEQSWERKMWEASLALLAETNYTKDELLEMYLNTTYYGAGATGIKAASSIYFGKSPHELTLQESATLAGLPNAPSALNPYENPNGCKNRRNLVLTVLQTQGKITEEEANTAKAEPLLLSN